ncbi:MAG TPA: hypothetical protein VGM88_05120 [Kofleriaceae bacterium]|jgi:hypothetical protein
MGRLDGLRAKAFGLVERAPGRLRDIALKANDALGRPLADAAELEDRAAFGVKQPVPQPVTAKPASVAPSAAPVIVYHADKTRRDAKVLTDMLDAEKVPYRVSNIQEDEATMMAIKRDSKGFRLPLIFIAGEVIGGRAELSNLIAAGDLKKKVFG